MHRLQGVLQGSAPRILGLLDFNEDIFHFLYFWAFSLRFEVSSDGFRVKEKSTETRIVRQIKKSKKVELQ